MVGECGDGGLKVVVVEGRGVKVRGGMEVEVGIREEGKTKSSTLEPRRTSYYV